MRGLPSAAPRAAALALALGAIVGCYHEDFLLGAYCVREEDCGSDQCCAGVRCRPEPNDCERGPDDEEIPFDEAYKRCQTDDACLVHGLVRCVRWDGAADGFCTDLCVGDPLVNCERHTFGFPTDPPLPRACVIVDDQSVCALDCTETNICPDDMECRTGVCVPTPP
jgi:hypothetical protein